LALPKAYRLLQLTTEFLDRKEEEREAFWRSPEGKKKFEAMRAEIRKTFDKWTLESSSLQRIGVRRLR
jgi:hypothetical protein